MNELEMDRDGTFRARPLTWGLIEVDSGAKAIAIEWLITAALLPSGDWQDWTGFSPGTIAKGNHWIVKKDGTPNEETVRQIVVALGWNGTFDDLMDAPPPVEAQVQVESDTYKGKTRHVVAWVNPRDHTPTMKKADVRAIAGAKAQYEPMIRALAATFKRPATAGAAGQGAQRPPPPGQQPAPVAETNDARAPAETGEIPF